MARRCAVTPAEASPPGRNRRAEQYWGVTPATEKTKLSCLRLAFSQAVADSVMATNPLLKWRMPKIVRHKKRILSHDEEPKLLASAEKLYGFHMRALIEFMLATWGRLGEVTKLDWADVDLDNAEVYFRSTKSFEDRYIPLERGGIIDTLRRLRAKTLQDAGPFTLYASRSDVKKKWDRIVKDAGIPSITRHDIRRTAISRALLAGTPSITVQRLAGHSSIETTMRYYAEVEKRDLRDGMRRACAG